jgi:hypothetical protein
MVYRHQSAGLAGRNANFNLNFAKVYSEARKVKLSLVLANQLASASQGFTNRCGLYARGCLRLVTCVSARRSNHTAAVSIDVG